MNEGGKHSGGKKQLGQNIDTPYKSRAFYAHSVGVSFGVIKVSNPKSRHLRYAKSRPKSHQPTKIGELIGLVVHILAFRYTAGENGRIGEIVGCGIFDSLG